MTNEALISDLEYATSVAKRAENSPLIGGPIGLMWTSLATVALLVHGAIVMGYIGVDASLTGLVWLAYGVVGTALSVIMSRKYVGAYGARNLANRVAEACWLAMGVMTAVVAITTVIAFAFGRVEMTTFNFIVPFAFALSAAAYGVIARLTGYGYLRYATIMSGLSTAITLLLVSEPSMYFVGGFLLLFSGVIPSIIELLKADA